MVLGFLNHVDPQTRDLTIIWMPHHIKENYSYQDLTFITSLTIAVITNERRNLNINITIAGTNIAWRVSGAFYSLQKRLVTDTIFLNQKKRQQSIIFVTRGYVTEYVT